MSFRVRAVVFFSLILSGLGIANAEEKPPIPVTIDSEPNTAYQKIIAEAAYQKGHDALAAGKQLIAIEQFEFACKRRNAKSCFNVGLLVEHQIREASSSLTGKPDTKLVARIIGALRESCDLGFQRGCAALVQYYRLSQYGIQNMPAAIELATSACAANEISACEDLAEMHYRGEGMATDLMRAASLFKTGCDANGRALSCFNYALMNEKGQGVTKNAAVALEYYRIGCRRGSDVACINLSAIYRRASSSPADREIANGLVEKSCNSGAMVACSNLAVLAETDEPTPAGKATAALLYRKACDGLNGNGCRGLGNLAHDGVKEAGTKREAIKFFVKGCQLGSGSSCYNAGLMYNIGFFVRQNPSTALSWFGEGCSLGSAPSCAGAALAAVSMKPGDPNGGEEVAKKWLDHARHYYPEDGLVKAMSGWLSKGGKASETPKLPQRIGAD